MVSDHHHQLSETETDAETIRSAETIRLAEKKLQKWKKEKYLYFCWLRCCSTWMILTMSRDRNTHCHKDSVLVPPTVLLSLVNKLLIFYRLLS